MLPMQIWLRENPSLCFLAKACRAAGVPLIVNDRVDVALAAGPDVGVHVGQDDLPAYQVK